MQIYIQLYSCDMCIFLSATITHLKDGAAFADVCAN